MLRLYLLLALTLTACTASAGLGAEIGERDGRVQTVSSVVRGSLHGEADALRVLPLVRDGGHEGREGSRPKATSRGMETLSAYPAASVAISYLSLLYVPAPTPDVLTESEVRALAAVYDWSVDTVVCIAWRESRFDRTAVSDTQDAGLMQLHEPVWRPYFLREWGEWRPYDARWAMKAAYHIYELNGRTFAAWRAADGEAC